MRTSNYELKIIGGKETSDGFVALVEGEQYGITIANYTDNRCDVELLVNGERVGVFRLEGREQTEIEGPSDTVGRFRFFARHGLGYGHATGLITAVFKSEVSVENTAASLSLVQAEDQALRMREQRQLEIGNPKLWHVTEKEFVTVQLRLEACKALESPNAASQIQTDVELPIPTLGHPASIPVPLPQKPQARLAPRWTKDDRSLTEDESA